MLCQLLCLLLSVGFEQLVDQGQFIYFPGGVEGWEGVSLVLDHCHLRSVIVLSSGKLRQSGETIWPGLEPGCKDLEELWDEILLREPEARHFHRLRIRISSFGIVDQLFGIELNLVGPSIGGLYPLMADQSGQEVPQHVDPGLRAQTHRPVHPAMADQQLQCQPHLSR